jgi:DNA-binding CsgD family transcriptional regulator
MRSAALLTSQALPTVLAGIGHGSHLCAFYETKDDLIDLVLPFFDRGIRRGELCVWMIPDTVSADEATLHTHANAAGNGIELYRGRDLYLKGSYFERDQVVRFWDKKLQQALTMGHQGMCCSGDAFWLQPSDWSAFLDYERDIAKTIAGTPITLLCTYPLSVSKIGDIFDVACAHHVAIVRRRRQWEVIKGWGFTEAPPARRQNRIEALEAADRILSLSQRERQVLDRLVEGRPSKTIAQELGISVRTVELHRVRLLNRLNVRTTAEAVRLATLASLITHA